MRTRHTTKYAFVLLIVVVTALLALAWQRRDLPFTSRARLLATNSKQWSEDGFLWLSNHQIAYRRYDPRRGQIRYSDFVRDFDADIEKPIKELSRLNMWQKAALRWSIPSPNSNWRLTHRYMNDGVSFLVMKNVLPFQVDHVVRLREDSANAVSISWWRNSEGWSSLWLNTGRKQWFLERYRRDQARPDSVADVSFLFKPYSPYPILVGFSKAGNPIAARFQQYGWSSSVLADFIEVQDAVKHQVRTIPFKNPAGAKQPEREPISSSSGERLLWLYRISRDAGGWPGWIANVIPSLQSKRSQRTYEEFWVSAIDGTDLHRAGWREVTEANVQSSRLTKYGWMPDGKHIYYELNGNLYSFAVD